MRGEVVMGEGGGGDGRVREVSGKGMMGVREVVMGEG